MGKFKVKIEKKRVKNLSLRVISENTVLIRIPFSCSEKRALDFVTSKEAWIEKQFEKLKNRKDIFLKDGEVLLFGEGYAFKIAPEREKRFEVFSERKEIESGIDLRAPEFIDSFYQNFSKIYFSQRILKIANEKKFTFKRLTVREQKTRWGSCSSSGAISLNLKLIKTPKLVIDSVIIHELCHTVHANHSKYFWALVNRHDPHEKESSNWLKTYSHCL